ncbi:hypothetical protein B0H13DRAFT_2372262 [Mycena leptocephala]|nr:hypothetical protein B0H13DRAFT_2372262 [Mycena leptocephala]
MPKVKSKRTQDKTLERRAEVAWLYRRRNREAINEKARLRMQKRREELRSAPAAVQAEHQAKARQYRQKYLDRNRPVSRPKVKVSPAKKNSMDSQKKSRTSTELGQKSTPLPTVHVAPVKPMNPVCFRSPPPRASGSYCRSQTPPTPTPRAPKHCQSKAPRCLVDIAASDSESRGESDEEVAWDRDNEDETPLRNRTGHPDYIPEPGQQPYFRDGRRYWF